ncbi:hypothetical protein ARMSODRAFT_168382 [Armillaria solidipes]|uniref:Uncharacterized protein n=1 Tax=Armillaria solidipes TaxID=1076256 RepID=A0A2H3C2N4_9AGAR|nr:hypothetical protein ARMSODRAFT_168382 [Armillaria solidipes]
MMILNLRAMAADVDNFAGLPLPFGTVTSIPEHLGSFPVFVDDEARSILEDHTFISLWLHSRSIRIQEFSVASHKQLSESSMSRALSFASCAIRDSFDLALLQVTYFRHLTESESSALAELQDKYSESRCALENRGLLLPFDSKSESERNISLTLDLYRAAKFCSSFRVTFPGTRSIDHGKPCPVR